MTLEAVAALFLESSYPVHLHNHKRTSCYCNLRKRASLHNTESSILCVFSNIAFGILFTDLSE